MKTENNIQPVTEGWTWLIGTPKWHYFRNGESLCGRWMKLGNGGLEQGNNNSPDNCNTCKKKLLAEIEASK